VRAASLALLGAAALAAPATAQSVQFSALLRGSLGYGTNPFVRPGVSEGSGVASGSFAPKLLYQTERSATSLEGEYDRDQYFTRFGYTDSARATLKRTDQFSANFQSILSGSFSTTNKATIADPEAIDNEPLNIGQRTYRSTGSMQLQWQANAKDQFTYGAQIEHLAYGDRGGSIPNLIASSYTQYSINGGYVRALDARTTVGVQATVSTVHSELYPNSRAIQPAITAKRQLSAIWTIDGSLGVVLQHVDGPLGGNSTSLGYGLNLCGTYPRSHICLSAQHQTSPSGYGALRTNTTFSGTYSRELTEHSRLSATASYYKTSSDRSLLGPALISNARAILATGQYDRDLTQRLSAGLGGTYQWRKTENYGSGHSLAGSVHVTAKLGRI